MTPKTPPLDTLPVLRNAWLCVNAHKGQAPQGVEVIQIFEDRVRIRAKKTTILGGRGKILQPGETALVPAWAVQNRPPARPEGGGLKKAKGPKRKLPIRFFAFEVETTRGTKVRYYKSAHEHTARGQADKVDDIIRVGRSKEVTEAEWLAGRKANGQD